jgi:hypothetical protein
MIYLIKMMIKIIFYPQRLLKWLFIDMNIWLLIYLYLTLQNNNILQKDIFKILFINYNLHLA